MRLLLSDWLSDVCYYYSSASSTVISAIVARRLNEAYSSVLNEFPDFDGPVMILGHSLGGVITFDLLGHEGTCPRTNCPGPTIHAHPNVDDEDDHSPHAPLVGPAGHPEIHYPFLDFKPAFLFLLGCPLGAVHVQRNQSFKKSIRRLPCPLVNIFQSHDPFGYRTEPLLDARYAQIQPEILSAPGQTSTDLVPATSGPSFRDLLTVTIRMPELPISLPRIQVPITGMGMPSITLPSFSLPSLGGARKVHVEVDYQVEGGEAGEGQKRKREEEEEEERKDDEVVEVVDKEVDTSMPKRTRTMSDDPSALSNEPGMLTRLGSFFSSSFSSFRAVVVGPGEESDELSISGNLTTMLADAGIDAQQAFEPMPESASASSNSVEPPNPRLDYVFAPQRSYLDMLSANEYLNGIRGHFSYWKSREAMSFMIRKAVELADLKKEAEESERGG
jgi:hypothetical protein